MTRVGRASVACVVVIVMSGCGGDEALRIDSAAPRELDDRVIDVFTTSACGDVRVEVDEDDDKVTLRAYDDRPGDDCAWAEGVADLATPLAGRTIIDGSRGVALDVP
jgi:hypothetical protein